MSIASSVVVVENHDEAYHVWRRMGVSARTLVHVDAHHDMWWLEAPCDITIANYVCQAIKDGLVSNVIWVVPDKSWDTRASRRVLRRHLRTLALRYSAGRPSIRSEANRLSMLLGTTPVMICALGSLPALAGPVLLDIDTDFLVLPVVTFGRNDVPDEYPWMWPDELVTALRAHSIVAEVVTIAYSVEGGYTPIAWKYLGDMLARAWQDPAATPPGMAEGYAALREAAMALERGDRIPARMKLEDAAERLPLSAAPLHQLAVLHWSRGDIGEARRRSAAAASLDPAYRGPYATLGLIDLADRRFAAAARAWKMLLDLDPENAYAHLGQARIAMHQRRWPEAETALRRSLAVLPRLVDAHRDLGDVLTRQGRDDEATAAYARSLKLALEGEVPLAEPVFTAVAGEGLRDRGHGRVHAKLARLDARRGRAAAAIAGYRMAIASGYDRAGVRMRLARLLLAERRWSAAGLEIARTASRVPSVIRRAWRSAPTVIRHAFARWRDRASDVTVVSS